MCSCEVSEAWEAYFVRIRREYLLGGNRRSQRELRTALTSHLRVPSRRTPSLPTASLRKGRPAKNRLVDTLR